MRCKAKDSVSLTVSSLAVTCTIFLVWPFSMNILSAWEQGCRIFRDTNSRTSFSFSSGVGANLWDKIYRSSRNYILPANCFKTLDWSMRLPSSGSVQIDHLHENEFSTTSLCLSTSLFVRRRILVLRSKWRWLFDVNYFQRALYTCICKSAGFEWKRSIYALCTSFH